jgi:hypothetical protein
MKLLQLLCNSVLNYDFKEGVSFQLDCPQTSKYPIMKWVLHIRECKSSQNCWYQKNVFSCSVEKGSEGGVFHLELQSFWTCPYIIFKRERII